MKQLIAFVTKEFRHILRDKRTLLVLVVMPMVMTLLFGYAISAEVKNIRVAVLDYSTDEVTTKVVEHISHNPYFTLVRRLEGEAEIDRVFLQNEVDLVIAFSRDFASEMRHSGKARIQILTDGTEPNQAAIRTGYMQQLLAACLQEEALREGVKPALQIEPVIRFLYNPQGKSAYNFVPGIIGVILLLTGAMMTSIAIVKEKETGTMEVLLASPLPPIVIVVSKLVPYFMISCLNLAIILLMSTLLLHLPIAGSLVGLVSITMLYILVSLLIGLLISTCVSSQLAAMLLSLLIIVPTIYLSGLAFPIESMAVPLQYVSVFVPARWYVSIARRVMIQGVPIRYVMQEVLTLGVMVVVLLSVSWKMFKTRL